MLSNKVHSFDCLKPQLNDRASHFPLDLWLNSTSLAKEHVFFLILIYFEIGVSTKAASNRLSFGGKVAETLAWEYQQWDNLPHT